MFKEALGALSSSLVGAVKDTVSEYKPTAQNMGGAFTRIAQQGIANLSFRSPILADMAATMLHNFQSELVNRDTVKQYVVSDKSADLRKEVESNLGKDASKEKVDKEMFKVLDKMRTLVDREGEKAASSSDTFKQYGKFFEKFQKDLNPKKGTSETKSEGGLGAGAESKLAHIEDNTLKTVKILSGMSFGETQEKKVGDSNNSAVTPEKKTNPYVDPYTGLPSINAAIGGIGGNFLAKVFDDDVISKYATKAKKKLFGETKEENIDTPKKTDQISGLITPEFRPKDVVKTAPAVKPVSDVSSILGDLSLDVVKTAPAVKPVSDVSSILGDLSLDLVSAPKNIENQRESDADDERQHRETKSLQEKTVDELKALHATTKANGENSGGIFSTIIGLVGSIVPVLGLIGPALATIGGVLSAAALPAAAIAGGAIAGAAIGTAAKETIDYGITKAVGKEETLGGWLHDKFSGNDEKIAEALKPTQITPKQTTGASINTVSKLEEKKESESNSSNTAQSVNPVAINSTTNNNSSTNVIVGSSVRNQESTFERVQMSNFWGP
jgi:hypothetical protein